MTEDQLPAVSVIVAVRNEEENILACLKSLDALVYPENKIEIIVVNDASTDNTAVIIDKFIIEKKKFVFINLPDENDSSMKGKVRAVAAGIKSSNGEIILTTDADCVVNPMWAKTIASYHIDDVGVVNGFTTQKSGNIFSGIQAIDLIYLLFIAAGTINNGKPVSCIGNNMSFSRKAYEKTGGFEHLPFSVTEDFLLLNAIHKLKKYKVIYPLDRNALLTASPCKSLKELFNQKKRWAVGGIDSPPFGLLLMSIAFFSNIFVLLTPFFITPAWIYLILFKVGIDLFVLFPVHQKLGLQENLKYFLLWEIYYIIYTTVLPVVVLFSKKVKWKDRVY